MIRYVLRRLAVAIPLLLALLTLNFFLLHAAPGDPTEALLPLDADESAREALRRDYGLDRPLPIQYLHYLERVVLHLDLGRSRVTNRPVRTEIFDRLPNTLLLAGSALLVQYVVGIAAGLLAAARPGSRLDRAVRVVTLTIYSTPSFYLGLLLIFVFAGGVFRVLPVSSTHDVIDYHTLGPLERLADRLRHLVLPALTLGLGSAAALARFVRGEMLEALGQDWVRTARAKGLPERTVLLKHAFRNALAPLITLLGLGLPFLFSGSVIVETVFDWPGMGLLAVDAAKSRNYPVFLAANLLFAALVIAGSLLADVLYAVADPRVRTGWRSG